jgi:hypothetical protein
MSTSGATMKHRSQTGRLASSSMTSAADLLTTVLLQANYPNFKLLAGQRRENR